MCAPSTGAVRLTAGAVVSATAAARLIGADNCMVDRSATACSPVTIVSTGWLVCGRSARLVDILPARACWDWRRHAASTANRAGDSTGATGLSVSDPLRPAHASALATTRDTTLVSMGGGSICAAAATGAVRETTESICCTEKVFTVVAAGSCAMC